MPKKFNALSSSRVAVANFLVAIANNPFSLLVLVFPATFQIGVPPNRTVRVGNFAELRRACENALPGDTIILSPGTYTLEGVSRIEMRNRPGPVTVRGATGNPEDVLVRGHGQNSSETPVVFELEDSPRWTFENLSTADTYYHGFKLDLGSTDCVLRNVKMRDHGESGVKGASDPTIARYPDRLLVERCDIGFSTTRGGSRDVVEGIDGVGVADWIVRNCRFVNIRKPDFPNAVAYGVFTKGNASGTIIERNRFEGCDVGASFGGGGTGAPYFREGKQDIEHTGGAIQNNVFIRCRDAGIYVNKGLNCRIDYNTLFECGLSIQLRYSQSSGRVRNNLVLPSPTNSSEPWIRVRDGARLTDGRGNLLVRAEDFAAPKGDDAMVDLTPSAASRAIGAGVDIGTDVTNDFLGHVRPIGASPTVGAYEFPKKVPAPPRH